ncbi:MAG: DNA primase, partial [Lachnospiraceae bacterium]|nr:DNA primase [Candidatus Equihabitans merdae]
DPDELIVHEGAESMQRRLKEARDVFMFEFDQLSYSYNMKDPQDATVFQKELAKRLLRFTEEMELNNYIRACAEAYHLSENALRKMVGALSVRGTAAEHYQAPKKTGKSYEKKEDTSVLTEKLMLTYLANYPEAFTETRDYIGPEDFHDELCHQIAIRLYEQHQRGQVMEASLLNSFTDSAMQQEVAGLFHTSIPVDNEGEADRAFTDTVLGLMSSSYNTRMNNWQGDVEELMTLTKRKTELEQLKSSKMFHLSYQNTGEKI